MDALNGYRVNGTIAVNSSRQFFAEGLIRVGNSNYQIGFGTDGNLASASVGHGATNNEGLFWHTGSNYGIYRTAGAWSSPTYQQLRLDWPTGIVLSTSARGSYSYSYVNIEQSCNIGENLQIGTQSVLSGLGQLGFIGQRTRTSHGTQAQQHAAHICSTLAQATHSEHLKSLIFNQAAMSLPMLQMSV